MKKVIFLLFLFSIFISCKKWSGDNTTVRGKVINDITKQPMKGFRIDVIENKTSSFTNRTSSVAATAYTNTNGEFETKFHARWQSKYSYELSVGFDNQMYVEGYTENFLKNKDIVKTKSNFFDIWIAPAGNLTVQLSPPPPYGIGDSIQAIFNHPNWILPNKISVTNKTVNGDGIAGLSKIFMGQWLINITKVKSGITTYKTDTIYLNWNESKTYTINF